MAPPALPVNIHIVTAPLGASHVVPTRIPPMPATPPRLLGSYATPPLQIGDRVVCALRGEVEVVGLSSGPIPWPIGRTLPRGRQRFLIVCDGLAEAIRRESAEALQHWWGMGADTVRKWRRALGVTTTEGTDLLKREVHAAHLLAAREAALPKLSSAERRARISAAMTRS
jgi:hypothetical protein